MIKKIIVVIALACPVVLTSCGTYCPARGTNNCTGGGVVGSVGRLT